MLAARTDHGLSRTGPVGSAGALDAEIWISERCGIYAVKHSEGHWESVRKTLQAARIGYVLSGQLPVESKLALAPEIWNP